MIKQVIAFGVLAVGLAAPSVAQHNADASLMTPYGQKNGQYARPFETAKRGPDGTRIVINGRIIDAGDSVVSRHGVASNYRAGVSPQSSTLGRSTLNATSIGNNVTINNVSNSVIHIRQTNNGNQNSFIRAK